MGAKTKTAFDRYLGAIRSRERSRLLASGFLIALLTVVSIIAVTTALGIQRGFTPNLVWAGRLLVVLAGAVCLYVFVIKPWRQLSINRGTTLIEEADSAFDGRAETWLSTLNKNPDHPFLEPLADDAMRVANRVPKKKVIKTGAIGWPVLGLMLLIGAGAGFVQYANTAWQNGASHVLFGWAKSGLVAQRDLTVTPGNVEILSGDDVTVSAVLKGFTRETVSLEVKYGDAEWQSTDLTATTPDQFEFTLFRVTEALQYRISAKYIESEIFNVSVIEPARLEGITAEMTYPEWTALDTQERSNVRSISGVNGTEVTLVFETDKPLTDPVLVMGFTELPLTLAGNQASASFTITDNTTYQLKDRLLGRDVNISPEHPVNLRGDNPPNVKFIIPGNLELILIISPGGKQLRKILPLVLKKLMFFMLTLMGFELFLF